jgi:lysozyme
VPLVKESEALRLKAYMPTSKDRPTIGWGHTRNVRMGMTCTVEQAEKWLAEDLAVAEKSVRRLRMPLTQNQWDALVSFCFNVGDENFRTSTMFRLLNQGEYRKAADQFDRWIFQKGVVLGGLIRRRAREKKLFLTPDKEIESGTEETDQS